MFECVWARYSVVVQRCDTEVYAVKSITLSHCRMQDVRCASLRNKCPTHVIPVVSSANTTTLEVHAFYETTQPCNCHKTAPTAHWLRCACRCSNGHCTHRECELCSLSFTRQVICPVYYLLWLVYACNVLRLLCVYYCRCFHFSRIQRGERLWLERRFCKLKRFREIDLWWQICKCKFVK